jgi:hypothetical protein
MIKTKFRATITCLRFDNVIELALTKFLQDQGTLYKFSCVERPEHNSIVEREHNTY